MEAWKTRAYAAYADPALQGTTASGTDARQRAFERWQYLRRYRRFLPSSTAAPILDVGCGTGTFVEALQSRGYSGVEGIDASLTQVDKARASGLTSIKQGSALDHLRTRPEHYQLITAFSVLEHQTRPELFELLEAIRGSLRPGGVFIAVVPNAKGLFGAHVRFADITHELSFTPASVLQVSAMTGLEIVTIFEHGPIVHGLSSALRWTVWQAIRGALVTARIAEGADWRWPVFTQDLVLVARRRGDTS